VVNESKRPKAIKNRQRIETPSTFLCATNNFDSWTSAAGGSHPSATL
jgi:hypothetical protein